MLSPSFWETGSRSIWPRLLEPFGLITGRLTASRVARPGWQAPVPVICCGNVTVGGTGKTIVAIDLLERLRAGGAQPHCLLRGYGGAAREIRHVSPHDDPAKAGDEALLLAEIAPTWIGGDRAASARAAISGGAGSLVLDDGLQNPTLAKDLSLLVIDGGFGFGNGRLLPAGPLRESVATGAARCHAAVLIGPDAWGASARLPHDLPVLGASLIPGPEAAALTGRRVVAFAGIGRPAKFFATLEQIGAVLAARLPFPDHHRFTATDLRSIREAASRLDAVPVTTAKDAVRLGNGAIPELRVLSVTLAWHDEAVIEKLLARLLSGP